MIEVTPGQTTTVAAVELKAAGAISGKVTRKRKRVSKRPWKSL